MRLIRTRAGFLSTVGVKAGRNKSHTRPALLNGQMRQGGTEESLHLFGKLMLDGVFGLIQNTPYLGTVSVGFLP